MSVERDAAVRLGAAVYVGEDLGVAEERVVDGVQVVQRVFRGLRAPRSRQR